MLKRFNGFMNLNMKITRSRGEKNGQGGSGNIWGRIDSEREIIKKGDSFQRCNNSNYDLAALLSHTSVFEENVYGRAWLYFLSFYYESIHMNSLKSAYVSG